MTTTPAENPASRLPLVVTSVEMHCEGCGATFAADDDQAAFNWARTHVCAEVPQS